MEFADWISNYANSFSEGFGKWANNYRTWERQTLHDAQHGSHFSNYLFPWMEKATNPGNSIKGPPHIHHLATNHPVAERGNKGHSSHVIKYKKSKVIRPKRVVKKQKLRRRHRRN